MLRRRDVGPERLDPGRAGVLRQALDQHRADAAVLAVVGDRERHLGHLAVPHETRDPDRLAADERHEHVVVGIDAREQRQVGREQHVLRAAEAEQARARPEPVEDRLNRLRLAVPKRADRHSLDELRLHGTMLPTGHGPARRPDGPSFQDGPSGPLRFAYMEQEIRYLEFEGRRLAYSTYGEGAPIVVGPRWVSHLEEEWADPDQQPFYRELARTHRVVRFDRIGCGLSSRELDPRPTVESESRQLEAVIDAVGGSAVVFSSSCCCLAASQLAVRRPGATERIVYFGGYASRHDIPDATKALADRVHPLELVARRSDARRPLRPARLRR